MSENRMKFWVVTASFNQVDWLKLCIASVRDQVREGEKSISVHHHIQDGASTDGTVEWLHQYQKELDAGQWSDDVKAGYSFSFSSERDDGMYDAINKGWEKSEGNCDVLCYLNCDEQYLEGGLDNIRKAFKKNPATDLVFANLLILNDQGQYFCHRRGLRPLKWLVPFAGPAPTAVTFMKSDVFFEKNCRFRTEWKICGDLVWYNELVRKNNTVTLCNDAVSIYTITNENLSLTSDGEERVRYNKRFLGRMGRFRKALSMVNLVRRMCKDLYMTMPTQYAIYRPDSIRRVIFSITRPTSVWEGRERLGRIKNKLSLK